MIRDVPHATARPASCRPRQSRGYTLIELLMVISVSSAVFSTVAVTLHLLQRVNHQLHGELPQSEALMRLTLRLRADAHASHQFSIETGMQGGPAGQFIQPDDLRIAYRQQGSVVIRQVTRNSQSVHQEQYRCAVDAELAWLRDPTSPSIVTLLLNRSSSPGKNGSLARRVDRIDAALGLGLGVDNEP